MEYQNAEIGPSWYLHTKWDHFRTAGYYSKFVLKEGKKYTFLYFDPNFNTFETVSGPAEAVRKDDKRSVRSSNNAIDKSSSDEVA